MKCEHERICDNCTVTIYDSDKFCGLMECPDKFECKICKKENKNMSDKALTLEELKERNKKAVWCQSTDSDEKSANGWYLVNSKDKFLINSNKDVWTFIFYGQFYLAYDKEQPNLVSIEYAVKNSLKIKYGNELLEPLRVLCNRLLDRFIKGGEMNGEIEKILYEEKWEVETIIK